MREIKGKGLKLLNEKTYLIRYSGRGAIVNIPSVYMTLAQLKVGDPVFLYMHGDDLVISKNLYK